MASKFTTTFTIATAFTLEVGCAKPVVRAPQVEPTCEVVRGKMPKPLPDTADARGVLVVAPALHDSAVHVGISYSTQDGQRRTKPVGQLVPKAHETRFHCVAPTPPDATFWEFVLLAEPRSEDECGYFSKISQGFETEVILDCRSEHRESWAIYASSFGQ